MLKVLAEGNHIILVQVKFQTAEVLKNTHLLIKLLCDLTGFARMEWMSFVIKVITMCLYDVVIVGPEVVFYRQCGSAETSNFIYSVFCFKAFVWRPALRALAATAAIYQPALMCFSRGFSVFGKPPQSRLKPGGRSALRHQGCLVVNHHSFKQISITIRAGAAAVAEDLDRRHDANWAFPSSRASLLGVWPQVEASLARSCVLTEPSAAVLKVNCANMQGITGDPTLLNPN